MQCPDETFSKFREQPTVLVFIKSCWLFHILCSTFCKESFSSVLEVLTQKIFEACSRYTG